LSASHEPIIVAYD